MSKYLESTALLAALSLMAGPAVAEKLGLGRAALAEEIAAWDMEVHPDGTGLPEGSGDAITGEEIYVTLCAACHGDFAEGIGNWPKLAGGMGALDHEDPLKTVGSFWPYLSTGFDYIKRSMPYGNAGMLTNDETYAILAYILYSNDLVEDDFLLSRETFFEVEMPNAGGFIVDDRAQTEYAIWSGAPCMSDCKPAPAQITMRAMVLDVTPQEEVSAVVNAAVEPEPEAVRAAGFDADLAAEGEKVFAKCRACHQVGEGARNGVGPLLNGIVGHPVGAIEGFRYSRPMAQAGGEGLIWSEAELAVFLANPRDYMRGTRMAFAGLRDADEQRAVIEYLKSFPE